MKSHVFTLISTLYRNIGNLILILSIVGAVVSCTTDPVPQSGRGKKSIGVNVLESDIASTKSESADAGEQLFDSFVVDTIGGQEIRLDAYVSDFNPDCPGEETKGTITTTSNITKFWMNAYAHDTWYDNEIPDGTSGSRTNPKPAGEYFSKKIVSRTSTSSSVWSIADSPKWLNDVSMTFWSWAGQAESSSNPNNPAPGLTPGDIDLSNNKASISYTTNGNLDLVYAFNKENRKFNEKTGEITEGSGTYNTGYKDAMDIKFHHALSAIRFDISKLKENGLTIKEVTFKGVVNQATCVITADPSKTGNPLAFAWTPKTVTAPETNKADLSMEFNASEDFTATGVDGTTTNALMPMGSSKFLFFIPQTVKDAGIKVVLTYSIGTATETTTSEVALNHEEAWEPGKYYTYKLNYDGSYFFSLKPESESSTPVIADTVSYESKTSDNSHDIPIYSTKNSRNSDWNIKSYQVGNNTEVNIPVSMTSFTAGGLVVSQVTSGGQKNLRIKATKWEKKSVGDNAYWQNTAARETDLGWSPESWGSDGEDKGVIDLSKFDFQDETFNNSMTTANCYIIRHAGTYKFPLVYGNGIEGGSEITAAYAPTIMASGGVTARFLAKFKNHKGSDITSAFIENNIGCAVSASGSYAPSVVWSDNSGVITNLSIEGSTQTTGNYNAGNVRYVQFTIPQNKICQNNALIAVKDASGNIIWSWHIWTTNDPSLLSPPIHVTNYNDNGYDFFPINCLGWADAGTYPAREDVKITLVQKDSKEDEITITVKQPKTLTDDLSTGVHFQWGRKDPMPTKASGFPKKPSISSQVTLADAIKKPDTFVWYNDLNTTNWCSSTYYNLWTGMKCVTGGHEQDNSSMIKTIYDPSPAGYKLPASSAFSGFTTTGENQEKMSNTSTFNIKGSFANGYYFYTCKSSRVTTDTPTIFFPTAGIISSGNGEYKRGWDYDGNFWSAFPGSDTKNPTRYGCYLSISKGTSAQSVMVYNSANLALGASVRPVKWK